MPTQHSSPVVCFSYIAAASLWNVGTFPTANDGAAIHQTERSIAADGPMVAAVLTALGQPNVLLVNNVGADSRGAEVSQWVERHLIGTAVIGESGIKTPEIVVVADDAGNRTWFAFLPDVGEALGQVDMAPIANASFAYIDCYELIRKAAIRVIQAACTAHVPILLNLGGSPLTHDVTDVIRGHPPLIVQTSVKDEDADSAPRLASVILAETEADWVVITAGESGVFALGRNGHLHVPAFRATVRHTHCAGAAFSGALLHGLLSGWDMHDSLLLACASGAMRCERGHQESLPTLAELRRFQSTRARITPPAA